MQVKFPDKDDWGKVKRLRGYLKGTLNMPLILSADCLMLSQLWVDVAYMVMTIAGDTGGQVRASDREW
jgi:hypothetical protein